MKKFYKQNSGSNEIQKVKNLLDSLEKNELIDELIDAYQLEEKINETIPIEYFNYLLVLIRSINREYEKEDIIISDRNIKCVDIVDNTSAMFTIENIPDDKVSFFGKKDIKIQSKKSVKKDYLDAKFSANKFISNLKTKDKDKLMIETLQKLERSFKSDNKILLRIIRSIDESDSYIRAIASTEYEDYNLNYSILLLYILLNKLKENHDLDFIIEEIRIDDSHIVVSVSSSKQIEMKSGAFLSFSIEMINDETKRDACKFYTVMHIQGKDYVLNLINPKKSIFLSISHRKNLIESIITKIENAAESISDSIDIILNKSKQIDSIKNPELVKNFIFSKVEDKRSPFTKKDRDSISGIFNKYSANSIVDLFELLGKIDLIIEDEDIKSREYWRNLLYNALIEKGR